MKNRVISPIGLLFISVSAILGSGWLFGSFYASQLAGPSAILSWIIAGIFVTIIAFTFAELCSSIPVSGSSVRIPQYTHGTVIGIFCSLNTWFCYVACTVIEVVAVMQYLSFYFPSTLYLKEGELSKSGYMVALVLLFLISLINTYSVKIVVKLNLLLTLVKIIIPISISILLICVCYNYKANTHNIISISEGFSPFGFHGIFAAISSGGIVLSYNAFKQAAEMGGEAKNPNFSIPFAIVGSIILCMIIFLFLQVGFLSALTPENLKNGWSSLNLMDNSSPFASLLKEHNLKWAIPILYFAAIVAPMSAALVYCTSAARALHGIAANGYTPSILLKLNKHNESTLVVLINFLLSIIMFLCFSDWIQIANFLTCLFVISYGFAPVCMIALRKKLPNYHRPFKLPFGNIWAYLAFFISTMCIYWVGWETMSKVAWFFLFSLIASILFQKSKKQDKILIKEDWKASIWFWIYLSVLIIISKLGNFGNGSGVFTGIYNLIFLAIFSAIILKLSRNYTIKTSRIEEQISKSKINNFLI